MKMLITRILLVIFTMAVVALGDVHAAGSKPDISSAGLKLGKLLLVNGATKTIKADAAKFHANGRCMFEASYVTVNTGGGAAEGDFLNILKREGKLVRRNNVRNLKPKAKKENQFLLALTPGDNHLELTLDNSNRIKESDEKNNTITATVKILGRCSGKTLTTKKKPANKSN